MSKVFHQRLLVVLYFPVIILILATRIAGILCSVFSRNNLNWRIVWSFYLILFFAGGWWVGPPRSFFRSSRDWLFCTFIHPEILTSNWEMKQISFASFVKKCFSCASLFRLHTNSSISNLLYIEHVLRSGWDSPLLFFCETGCLLIDWNNPGLFQPLGVDRSCWVDGVVSFGILWRNIRTFNWKIKNCSYLSRFWKCLENYWLDWSHLEFLWLLS